MSFTLAVNIITLFTLICRPESNAGVNSVSKSKHTVSVGNSTEFTWSPTHSILMWPLGAMNISTVSDVTLSDGGAASTTPPGGGKRNRQNITRAEVCIQCSV